MFKSFVLVWRDGAPDTRGFKAFLFILAISPLLPWALWTGRATIKRNGKPIWNQSDAK
jgi:hypothetical protein